MKVLTFMMFALLVLCAYFQLNDPDSAIWIVIYLSAATATLLSLWSKLTSGTYYTIASILLAYATHIGWSIESLDWLAAIESFKMHKTGVEEFREVSGLALTAAWLVFIGYRERPKEQHS